jgi:hypothetical protein
MIVQGAVNGAGGNTKGIGKIEESDFLIHGKHRLKTLERTKADSRERELVS